MHTISSGVPQGSCIGPLLFILYINDIYKVIPPSVHFGLYADDLRAYSSVDNCADLQLAIDNISYWSHQWNLSLSYTKCNVVHFGNQNCPYPYTIDGNPLISIPEVRDLGVLFSPTLYFNSRISKITKDATNRMNNILRCFKTKSIPVLSKAFVTYIRPLLEYACEVWSPTQPSLIQLIEKVQRSFTRRIFYRANLPHIPYESRLESLSLLSLQHRRHMRDLTFLYKSIHNFVHFDTSQLYEITPHSRLLRGGHPLRIALPFLPPGNKRSTLASRCINDWNSLPSDVAYSINVKEFSKSIHLFLSSPSHTHN